MHVPDFLFHSSCTKAGQFKNRKNTDHWLGFTWSSSSTTAPTAMIRQRRGRKHTVRNTIAVVLQRRTTLAVHFVAISGSVIAHHAALHMVVQPCATYSTLSSLRGLCVNSLGYLLMFPFLPSSRYIFRTTPAAYDDLYAPNGFKRSSAWLRLLLTRGTG